MSQNPNAPDQFNQFQQAPQKPGCFRLRNILLGCFGMVILCGGFGVVAGIFGLSLIKSSIVYTQAVAAAKANPDVQKKIGTPIKEGLIPSGNVNTVNDSGNANLSIPVSGPNGSGTIHAVATRSGGMWTYTVLEIEIGTEHISLMKESNSPTKGEKY